MEQEAYRHVPYDIDVEQALLGAILADNRAMERASALIKPEHFYDPLHRSIREHILDGTPLEPEGIALLAELDARAEAEGIDAATGEELLWRLRERELRRELQGADVVRTRELQELLAKLFERVSALSGR